MITTSILILAKNEERNIQACLQAVYSQTIIDTAEVILVDSGSTDCTLGIASRFPVRTYQIPPESFHHAGTRNFAATLARGEFLVYLAADALPSEPMWLEHLVGNFADPRVGAVYGRHIPQSSSTSERRLTLDAVYGDQRLVKEGAAKRSLGYRFYHFSTVNAAIRRDVWHRTGFPEDLKVYEDLGIAKRILDQGWKIVYEPRAAVWHSHNHRPLELLKRYFDAGVVWRRLGIWDADTKRSMLSEGWRLLRRRMERAPRGNATRDGLLASAMRDSAKVLGLLLGLNERFLPQQMKRRLSAVHLFE